MNEIVLSRMCCPACSGDLHGKAYHQLREHEIIDGVVWCGSCHAWYPVESGVLELLPPALAYRDDRQRFWAEYRCDMEALGLKPFAESSADVAAQRKQQEHFDWYAGNDTQSYTAYQQMPFWRAVDEEVFEEWRAGVQEGGWLLDVGCAEGRAVFQFTDLPLRVVGFDVSKALVRQAREYYRTHPGRAEATFFVGDACNLPFRAGTFDHVLIYGVLHHLPDPGQTCREVARVLKPGGTYFGSENNKTAFRKLFDILMKVVPIWHEEAGAEPLIASGDLKQWFRDTDVSLDSRTHVFVPPHLVNLLGRRLGKRLLRCTDWVGGRLPWVRHNGGLVTVCGRRAA